MALPAADPRPPEVDDHPPIVAAPPRRLSARAARVVGVVVALVAVAMVASLVAATRADRHGPYPGSRSGADASLIGNSPTLQGSDVDDFERTSPVGLGRYPGVGEWQVVAPAWRVVDGLAQATAVAGRPALAVVHAARPTYLFQVDLLDAQAGSGIAFRYQDVANYWAVQNLVGRNWELVRVVGGVRTSVRQFVLPDDKLFTLGVWVDGTQVQVANGTRAVLVVDEAELAGATGVGLVSLGGTQFDNASLYDG